jgi:preprotein translocase subunit SecE
MSFIQYLKDTRAELRHVAWPTRLQTIIYTVLVIALSLFFAAYLGFFDYVFTSGLGRVVEFLPKNAPINVEQIISTSTSSTIEFGSDLAVPAENEQSL